MAIGTAILLAIAVVFAALTSSHATPEILKYLFTQTLPKMAEGTANKLFVVPSELEGIASLGATFSAATENGRQTSSSPRTSLRAADIGRHQ